jgi:hypothetical protein
MMNGRDGAVVEPAQPAQTGQPIQPSHQAGPGGPKLTISQDAANALPQAKYDELARTGHIQGLTIATMDSPSCTCATAQGPSRAGSLSILRRGRFSPAEALTCGISTTPPPQRSKRSLTVLVRVEWWHEDDEGRR